MVIEREEIDWYKVYTALGFDMLLYDRITTNNEVITLESLSNEHEKGAI